MYILSFKDLSLSMYLPIHLSLSIYLSLCPYRSISIYLFAKLSICQSILLIYISIYTYVFDCTLFFFFFPLKRRITIYLLFFFIYIIFFFSFQTHFTRAPTQPSLFPNMCSNPSTATSTSVSILSTCTSVSCLWSWCLTEPSTRASS